MYLEVRLLSSKDAALGYELRGLFGIVVYEAILAACKIVAMII